MFRSKRTADGTRSRRAFRDPFTALRHSHALSVTDTRVAPDKHAILAVAPQSDTGAEAPPYARGGSVLRLRSRRLGRSLSRTDNDALLIKQVRIARPPGP